MKADPKSKRVLRKRQAAKLRRLPKSGCFVYALQGEGGVTVYVGQTRTPLPTRLSFHLKSASPTGSPIQRWLCTNTPQIVMLDANGVWDVCEILWIDRLRREGAPLLNVSRGGRDAGRRLVV